MVPKWPLNKIKLSGIGSKVFYQMPRPLHPAMVTKTIFYIPTLGSVPGPVPLHGSHQLHLARVCPLLAPLLHGLLLLLSSEGLLGCLSPPAPKLQPWWEVVQPVAYFLQVSGAGFTFSITLHGPEEKT